MPCFFFLHLLRLPVARHHVWRTSGRQNQKLDRRHRNSRLDLRLRRPILATSRSVVVIIVVVVIVVIVDFVVIFVIVAVVLSQCRAAAPKGTIYPTLYPAEQKHTGPQMKTKQNKTLSKNNIFKIFLLRGVRGFILTPRAKSLAETYSRFLDH